MRIPTLRYGFENERLEDESGKGNPLEDVRGRTKKMGKGTRFRGRETLRNKVEI